mgnify:CR=1 FL=1
MPNTTKITLYQHCLKLWKKQHFIHLLQRLEQEQKEYEKSFQLFAVDETNQVIHILENRVLKRYEREDMVLLLSVYYMDESCNYQTPFGDFLYYTFTDLLPEELKLFN